MPAGFKGFQRGALNPSSTLEGRERIRLTRTGRPLSEHTRRALSKAIKKALRDPAMRDKWALAQTGKTKTIETRMKIAFSQRRGRTKKISSVKKYADSAFSKYIRLKYCDGNGMLRCFTCDEMHHILEMDCGHYVSRMHNSLRYSELNAHPQCQRCNRFNEGRKDVYALRLIEKYGADILRTLAVEKQKVVHIDIEGFRDLARNFKQKAKELMAEKTGQTGPHPFFRDLPVGELS